MYTQTTAIAISSILFVFMLIGFVAQTAGMRADRFFAFDNQLEMQIVQIFSLFYSFGFVLWQTQISSFFFNNSEDTYRLIVGLCMALALIWACALISSLVAYTYNALLLFLLFANMIQSMLIPYALFRLKSQHEQYPHNISTAQQRQLNDQLQEQAKLLEELRVIKRKLEHAESNQHETSIGTELTPSTFEFDRAPRVTKVSFADQPYPDVMSNRYYR